MKGRIDFLFIGAAVLLLSVGTIVMISAASPIPYYAQILHRHFLALVLGIMLFLFGFGFNYQIFQDQARTIYILTLALMLSVLAFGSTRRGHKSWFHLSILSFQPVELARIGVVLVLANLLDRRARKITELSTVLWAMALAGPVMVLILKQPDFASMVTLFPLLLGMLFCAGASLSHLLALAGFGFVSLSFPLLYTLIQIRYPQAVTGTLPHYFLQLSKMGGVAALSLGGISLAAFLAWRLSLMMRMQLKAVYFIVIPAVLSVGLISGMLVNKQLKGYQRNRFVAFLSPQSDIRGASYNVHQSQIAIGSGGVWGKGLFSGTQGQLGFLPERHTDFIYAVIGEELGVFGALGILSAYLLLIWRIIAAARLARDRYGYLVCCGLASMYGFHLILNVGMCVGLMPVAGIPLPLISYGGSSLVITLWSLGIVANIYSRRYSFL